MKSKKGFESMWHVIVIAVIAVLVLLVCLLFLRFIGVKIDFGLNFLEGILT